MSEPIVSPIDGQVTAHFEYLSLERAQGRVDAAREAQRDWGRTSIATRVALCLGMLDAFERKLESHAQAISKMMGKPVTEARGEARTMRARVQALCALAPAALADEHLSEPEAPALGEPGRLRRFIRREPVGVVLDIAAWNYPLLVPMSVVVGAVLAGDAALIKHAPQTGLVGAFLADAFAEAGAPAGLVADFMCTHETVGALLDARAFDQVAFTGSTRGGGEVQRAAARANFFPVGLELGGKDPALVLPDCDFEFTVANLVEGAFYNAGQSCAAVERIYVHAEIWDRFVDAFQAQVAGLRMGDPLDSATTLGPVVDPAAASRIRAQVDAARSAGARELGGGLDFDCPRGDCYLPPAVFVDVDHSMALMREETFGPAIGLMKVDDAGAGIDRMNDSPYGLTASIWSRDDARVLSLAAEVQAGTVFQNRCDYLDPELPWVGTKDSGHGTSLSHLGLRALTRPKSFHLRTR